MNLLFPSSPVRSGRTSSSLFLFLRVPFFSFLHAGDVTQLRLPANMEMLSLSDTKVSGTLCGRDSE